jgi:cytidine deaminase
MKHRDYTFTIEEYDSINELNEQDKALLEQARKATENAYAPYSHFHVGAVARLDNGEILTGANQENASFPVGLCAERVILATASSVYPKMPINVLAISYNNGNGRSDHPIAPCGICRQSLQEYEERTGHPIRLILGGMEGKIYIISNAASLLPLAFTKGELV